MKIFGGAWAHPAFELCDAPVGAACLWCEESVVASEQGVLIPSSEGRDVAFHRECWSRQILGSVAHQEGRCSCRGGSDDEGDAPELTRREAARAALERFAALDPLQLLERHLVLALPTVLTSIDDRLGSRCLDCRMPGGKWWVVAEWSEARGFGVSAFAQCVKFDPDGPHEVFGDEPAALAWIIDILRGHDGAVE